MSVRKRHKTKIAAALLIILNEVNERNRKARQILIGEQLDQRTELTYTELCRELQLNTARGYQNFLRIDSSSYEELVKRVSPFYGEPNTSLCGTKTPNEQLAVTLHFLAIGQSLVELESETNIPCSSLGRLIMETCKAIIKALQEFIQLPKERNQWKVNAALFEELCGFPNCIGAIDGKHINIKRPKESASCYLNYNKSFSLILMAVVNAKYEFQMVEVGSNARLSDGEMFLNTNFYNMLETGKLHIPLPRRINKFNKKLPYVFIADDAFPLKENIIKPFSGTKLNKKQKKLNERFSSARLVVENTFATLASRFRILLTTINLSPEETAIIILAICYLHNYLRQTSYASYIGSTDIENYPIKHRLERDKNANLQDAANSSREKFMEYFQTYKV